MQAQRKGTAAWATGYGESSNPELVEVQFRGHDSRSVPAAMRPEKQREGSHRVGVARGRMFLKSGLGWLPGFPLGQTEGCVSWMALPRHGDSSSARIDLTRTHLREATQTWTRLVRGFPRAFPRLVDDPERWTEGVPQILQWLKGAIHDGKSLPGSLIAVDGAFPPGISEHAAAIEKRWPSLRPVLNALSWSTYLAPGALTATLPWIESNARAIRTVLDAQPENDGLVTVLRLWELVRQDGPGGGVSAILRFAGDPRARTVATRAEWRHVHSIAEALRSDTPTVELPRGELGDALTGFTGWLARQGQRTRRGALDLVDLTLPDDLLGDWEAWWAEVHRLVRERPVEVAFETFYACANRTPPELDSRHLIGCIRRATTPENRAFSRDVRKTLRCLPASRGWVLPRAKFLDDWLDAKEEHPHLIGPFMHAFRDFSSRLHHDAPERVDAWLNLVSRWPPNLTEDLLAQIPERSLWPEVLEALTEVSSVRADPDLWSTVFLVSLTRSAESATRCFTELAKAGRESGHVSDELLRCAWSLDRRPDRFAKIAAALDAHDGDHKEISELVTAADTFLEGAGWAGVAGGLVLDGEAKRLCDVGRRLVVTRAMGGAVEGGVEGVVDGAADAPVRPTGDGIPDWSGRYPEALWPVLGTLSGVTDDAERIAGRVLGKDCPDPESVRREISALEQRLTEHPDDPNLSRRLRNLRARMESGQAVSPARLGRLKDKLERAVRRNLVAALQARLQVGLEARLKQLLEADAIPAWMFEPPQMRVLAPMLRLSRAFRNLGLRLFRQRLGPPPWNLIEDPANQAFLTRLSKRGVNLGPWLNPPPPRTWTGSNGRDVVLTFEDDPLEIFQMGWHFSTCLSPGDFNFFSVFSNAADINKHVVYARDERGRVVGRCLLALTEDGNLLTFEPYCHDSDLELGKMIGQLAATLALRMNRVLVPRGKVPCLVAPDWYDDGPLDPCGRFEFLNDGSPLRQSLPTIDCDGLVKRLEEEFEPLPLGSLALSLVLELSELERRPELIRPLLPRLEACKNLPDRAWMRAAHLARLAGALGFSHRVLREVGVRHLLSTHRQFQGLDREAMTVLVEMEPATALRVLRKTRPRGVGSDEGETCPERLSYLARAYERLGREPRAKRLN